MHRSGALSLLCCLFVCCSTSPPKEGVGPAPTNGKGLTAQPQKPPARASFVDGLETPYTGRLAGQPQLQARLKQYAKHRKSATELIASRLGLVYADRKRVILFRLRDQRPSPAGLAPEVNWGALEWLVLEGQRRPVVTLYPEPILARQVTLREVIVFEMTRAALLHKMGAEYYQLPEWLRLGAAYYAADRGKTLIARILADLLPSTESPSDPLGSFDDTSSGRTTQGLLGYLALEYIASSHGIASLKGFLDRVVERRMSIKKAIRDSTKLRWPEFVQKVTAFGRALLIKRGKGLFPEYRKILALTVAGRDSLAVGHLNRLLEKQRHAYLSGNALYRLGRAYYKLRNYDEAHKQFAMIWLDHARQSPFLDRAVYWAACCRLHQKRPKQALARLEILRQQFPGSGKLPAGLQLAAQLLTEDKQLLAARDRHQEFLQRFPQHKDAAKVALAMAHNALARRAYQQARAWANRLIEVRITPPAIRSAARALLVRISRIESAPLPRALAAEISKLAQQLTGPQSAAAVERLQEIGPVAAPILGRLLATAPPAQHTALVQLLAEMANPRSSHFLIQRLPLVDRPTQMLLLKAMIRMGVPADLLPDMLESSGLSPQLIAGVRQMLGPLTFHTTRAVREKIPGLLRQLSHPDAVERMKGLKALNRLQDVGGMRALMTLATHDPEPAIRREAMDGLAVWGDQQAIPAFIAGLRDKVPHIRQVALVLVARHEARQAIAQVIPLLDDPDARVRSLAYGAAAVLGGKKLIPRLVQGLHDVNREVRQETMNSLLAIDREAVTLEVLRIARSTSDKALRGRVFAFLGRLTRLNLGYYPEATSAQRRKMLSRVERWIKRRQ